MTTTKPTGDPRQSTACEPQAVREAADLSVEQMADLMGMSLHGYQTWERGLRRPGEPAQRLLRLIDNDLDAVREVLA